MDQLNWQHCMIPCLHSVDFVPVFLLCSVKEGITVFDLISRVSCPSSGHRNLCTFNRIWVCRQLTCKVGTSAFTAHGSCPPYPTITPSSPTHLSSLTLCHLCCPTLSQFRDCSEHGSLRSEAQEADGITQTLQVGMHLFCR